MSTQPDEVPQEQEPQEVPAEGTEVSEGDDQE